MTALPLALLLACPAGALPRPPGGNEPSAAVKIDPGTLSPAARALYEADPAAFEREHGDALGTLQRWSQDPSLGQSECLAAKQDPRPCMEGRLAGFREVAKPEQLLVIQSYVKLLPRGVSAPLPRGGAGGADVGPPSAAASPRMTAAPAAAHASEFRAGPNTVQFSPVPAAPAADAPPPASWWEDQYEFYMCFYVPSRCKK